MKALRLLDWKSDPELVDVERPTPGPGQVLVRIGGAGAWPESRRIASTPNWRQSPEAAVDWAPMAGWPNSCWCRRRGNWYHFRTA